MTPVDIAIVGGGVIGSSIAYHLLTIDPTLSVCVVERDPTYRTASSSLSLSSIRQQFSTPVNIALSRQSMAFLKHAAEHLSVDGEAPELHLVERGYLFLASEAGRSVLERNHAVQREQGVDVALLDARALGERFPWLSTDGLALGSLGLSGEGWFDGYGLLQAFRRKARDLGAVYATAEVVAFDRSADRVTAIVLKDGTRVPCAKVVNAAGPQARSVALMAGIDLPVSADKHSIFVFECRSGPLDAPLTIDPSGAYFRPEGGVFLGGAPLEAHGSTDRQSLDVDYSLFDEAIWPKLAERVPVFDAVRVKRAWAGFYEMNDFDHNAILGASPQVPNFYCANGFSGHGMQHSPAAGRGMAELIVHNEYRTLDLRPLGFDRLFENKPIRELNII